MSDETQAPSELEELYRGEREIAAVPDEAIDRALERFERTVGGGGAPLPPSGTPGGGFSAAPASAKW